MPSLIIFIFFLGDETEISHFLDPTSAFIDEIPWELLELLPMQTKKRIFCEFLMNDVSREFCD